MLLPPYLTNAIKHYLPVLFYLVCLLRRRLVTHSCSSLNLQLGYLMAEACRSACARALTPAKDESPCANRGSLNCTFLASYSVNAPTLADQERPLRCTQRCQPLVSVVLSQQPKEAGSLHLPPPVSSSTGSTSSLNPIWSTCASPSCSPSSR